LSGSVWLQLGEIICCQKVRNGFDAVRMGGDRLSLATVQLEIQKLSSVHPAQGTH